MDSTEKQLLAMFALIMALLGGFIATLVFLFVGGLHG